MKSGGCVLFAIYCITVCNFTQRDNMTIYSPHCPRHRQPQSLFLHSSFHNLLVKKILITTIPSNNTSTFPPPNFTSSP